MPIIESDSEFLPGIPDRGPIILASPQLSSWASQVRDFLSDYGYPDLVAFATSGTSGSPPKAILFTRQALEVCAQGAITHMDAHQGDWCCPLPTWHVGGAMIHLRARLAGTRVYSTTGKWNPVHYTQFLVQSRAQWSSLVPTQVVDIVRSGLQAPPTLRSILVGGGQLDASLGQRARDLAWPIVQTYGMTEAGSQLATAFPSDTFHTDRLTVLPHWQVKTNTCGQLCFHGNGQLWGRVLTEADGSFRLDRLNSNDWWTTQDLVTLEGRLLSFQRRSDRLVKVLGELVDPDAVQEALKKIDPEAQVEALPHERDGAHLIACSPNEQLLKEACRIWNATSSGPQRIRDQVVANIPINDMGKIDRLSFRKLLMDSLNTMR